MESSRHYLPSNAFGAKKVEDPTVAKLMERFRTNMVVADEALKSSPVPRRDTGCGLCRVMWMAVAGFWNLLWSLVKYVFVNRFLFYCACLMAVTFAYTTLGFLCGLDIQAACGVKRFVDGGVFLFVGAQLMKLGSLFSGNAHQSSHEDSRQENKQQEEKAAPEEEDAEAVKTCCEDMFQKATAGLSEAQQAQVQAIINKVEQDMFQKATAGLSEAQQAQVQAIFNTAIQKTVLKRMDAIDGVYTTWLSLLSGVAMVVAGSILAVWAHLQTAITGVNARLGSHDTSLTAAASERQAIKERVDQHDADIKSLDERMAGLITSHKLVKPKYVVKVQAAPAASTDTAPVACGGPRS